MTVADLLQRHLATCKSDDTLERAAQLMWERDVGSLPVLDDMGRVVAMITDRDVCMGAYTQGKPLCAVPVHTVMSRQLVTCKLDDDITMVERLMRCHKVRRLPVVDEERHAIGVLALNDLARVANAGKLPTSDIVATLAGVGAPPWSLAPCR